MTRHGWENNGTTRCARCGYDTGEWYGDYVTADMATEDCPGEYTRCPACGDPIDYCQGHGETGDPAGYATLAQHDAGNHNDCADACEERIANEELAKEAEALIDDDAIDDNRTFWDADPEVAWSTPESLHGKLAALLIEAGWEQCYHRDGARFHYNVKLGGREAYLGYRDALEAMRAIRPAFDDSDERELEAIAQDQEQWELQSWWDDLGYNILNAAGITAGVKVDSLREPSRDGRRGRFGAYSCGRSAGYVNLPLWETVYMVPAMIRAGLWLQGERVAHNSRAQGEWAFDGALEEYDARRLEALASPRSDRVEA